ncbi:aminotransferase class I/II-fold pyridoxal phosphate-dependent enzyme [Candidatus Gottesmanbacteria bacterium]|nr:aminotransferase class I/II-fold pyridoxal phosphate-dependent enzyme [Candidatus Gottesmanbacteria bacterium]
MFLHRVISCSLSPNTEKDDVVLTFQAILSPWRWQSGVEREKVKAWLSDYLKVGTVLLFDSGRSAFLAILQVFGIREGDEVIVQAFTCVAVPNSVLWVGAKPIFADIDNTLNIDSNDVEKKITKRTKAIVVQHTFGTPANLDKLIATTKKHGLILIEDCAHSLGATYKGEKIGTFGDASFFSFGRDKVVSSVWGGAAIINDKCQMTNAKWKLRQIEEDLKYPSRFWIIQQLLHPIAFSFILPLYDVYIGKLLLYLLQKFRLLSKPVFHEELTGGMPKGFPARFPNALAKLLLNQLAKLDRFNRHRQGVAQYYAEHFRKPFYSEGIYLRFPLDVTNPQERIKKAKSKGVLLGNWYHNVIDPTSVDLVVVGYSMGSCPNAEKASRHIVNLPTLITLSEAKYVTQQLNR